MATNFRQDMPPKGGYKAFDWKRNAPKRKFSGASLIGGFLAFNVCTWTVWHYDIERRRRNRLEQTEGRIAIEPIITAEQERMYLRQLSVNRERENELMKDVPGWETGTLFGEPVFHNQAKRFPILKYEEYYAHNSMYDCYDRMFEWRWH